MARQGSKLYRKPLSGVEIEQKLAENSQKAAEARRKSLEKLTKELLTLEKLTSTVSWAVAEAIVHRLGAQEDHDKAQRALLKAFVELFEEVRAQHPNIADYLTTKFTKPPTQPTSLRQFGITDTEDCIGKLADGITVNGRGLHLAKPHRFKNG